MYPLEAHPMIGYMVNPYEPEPEPMFLAPRSLSGIIMWGRRSVNGDCRAEIGDFAEYRKLDRPGPYVLSIATWFLSRDMIRHFIFDYVIKLQNRRRAAKSTWDFARKNNHEEPLQERKIRDSIGLLTQA